jgi:uncharacterized damage-inducible protein DinB
VGEENTNLQNQPESILVELIHYNNWANAQVLAACQDLAEDQLTTVAPGAYGTIRDTMAHILRSEAGYTGRLTGKRPLPPFDWADPPSIADLSAFAGQVAAALLDAIQRTPPTQMVHVEDDGATIDYQARILFIQIINHGIEHRTNITTLLSMLGLTAPEVDAWGYLEAHPESFEMKKGPRETGE